MILKSSLIQRRRRLRMTALPTFEDAENLRERQKRKQFYVNCGMEPMGTEADLFGVRMELLGVRCHLDFESYRSFYRDHYSPWAAEHVKEVRP